MSNQTGPGSSYYRPLGSGRYRSTDVAQGAWSADEQHMAPVSALLTHAVEMCSPRTDLSLSRVTFDILGRIPGGEVEVAARVVRAGRTIELVEAEMTAGGRAVVRATAWRLATSDTTAVAATHLASIHGPDVAEPFDMSAIWPGGFIRSVEARTLGERMPGRSTVWLRSRVGIVEGAATSEQAALIGLVDTANGVAVRAEPGELLFPNTDLSVHLFRRPVGAWLGLQTEVSFGPDGLGLTSAVLHDLDGPFGRSAQTLTVRMMRWGPRPLPGCADRSEVTGHRTLATLLWFARTGAPECRHRSPHQRTRRPPGWVRRPATDTGSTADTI